MPKSRVFPKSQRALNASRIYGRHSERYQPYQLRMAHLECTEARNQQVLDAVQGEFERTFFNMLTVPSTMNENDLETDGRVAHAPVAHRTRARAVSARVTQAHDHSMMAEMDAEHTDLTVRVRARRSSAAFMVTHCARVSVHRQSCSGMKTPCTSTPVACHTKSPWACLLTCARSAWPTTLQSLPGGHTVVPLGFQ